jgi:hypothetical protein
MSGGRVRALPLQPGRGTGSPAPLVNEQWVQGGVASLAGV